MDEAELLLGHHAREDADVADLLCDFLRWHGLELRACHDPVRMVQVDFVGDGLRRSRIVARDHDDAHARAPALQDSVGNRGPDGVRQSDESHEGEVEVVLVVGQVGAVAGCARHAEDPQAVLRHVQHLLHDDAALLLRHMAQVEDSLGSSLGRDAAIARVHLPGVRQGEQLTRERILALELPVVVQVLGPLERAVPEVEDGPLHGVERVGLARQHRVFHQLMEPFGQGFPKAARRHVVGVAACCKLADGHLVHGKRAGLVDAEDSRGAQGLDGGHAARQHVVLGQPPRAHGHEDGEHDRELLGQDAHGERQSRQEALLPRNQIVAVGQAEHHGDDEAHDDANQSHVAHKAVHLALQRRLLGIDGLQGLADVAHLGPESRAPNLGNSLPCHHQGARVDKRQVFASGTSHLGRSVPLCLAYGDGLARQKGLVGVQVGARQYDSVRGNTVALGQHDDVAAYNVASRDSDPLAVAPHQGARARQVAQGIQRVLSAPLLYVGDADDDEDEPQQHERLGTVAEQEVERTTGEQQQEHRLLEDLEQHAYPAAFAGAGKLIGALLAQAFLCFRGRKSLWCWWNTYLCTVR